MERPKINFASENFAGVQGELLKALIAANEGVCPSYGNDAITRSAVEQFRQSFGEDIEVYFAFNGTGANNFGLSAVLQRHQSIFCTDVAHLYVDESTATETVTGCRLYAVPSVNGKMDAAGLRRSIKRRGDVHHPQPGAVTLSQPTEYGTVYTPAELRAIKAVCREQQLLLHVDGARLFNAAIHLNTSLKDLCRDAGIDVLTVGGTKTGMLFGEAVVFFHPPAGNAYVYHLKRSMQLASKNRFIAAQFECLLRDGLWRGIARHTNELAQYFARQIARIDGIGGVASVGSVGGGSGVDGVGGTGGLSITQPVQTNAVFVRMPAELYRRLQGIAYFYWWNEERSEARFMFSFDNTKEEVDRFVRDALAG